MSHTINPISTVTMNPAPGTTKQLTISIAGATQPTPQTVVGTVSVEFDGETVNAPLSVVLDSGLTAPSASIDFGGASNLTASFGQPTQAGPSGWQIPVTLTAV